MVHGCFGCWSRSAALHARQVRQHVVERRMVGEHEVLVHRQREPVTKRCHDFGLLDRINAQFTLKVLVHFDELCRVSCVFDDHFNHGCSDLFVAGVHRSGCCGSGGGCRLGSRLGCRLGSRWGFRFLDHAFEGSAWTPCLALHTAVEVAFSVDVRDQCVVLDAQHDVVRARKTSVPCQHGSTVHALTLDRPASHQRERNL